MGDGNLTAKSYHPTVIKLNKGISFLLFSFMTRRKQKVKRVVKYNPTLQRPLCFQKRKPACIPFTTVLLDNFRLKDSKA